MRATSNYIKKLQNRGMTVTGHTSPLPKNRAIVIEREEARQDLIKCGIIKTDSDRQTILGNVPSKSNCYKIITTDGHGSLAKTEALRKYEESFMWQCGKYRNADIKTPFEFYINVYYPSKRSDLDNSLKVTLDCLQKIKAISNDNNCCKIVAQKFIDKENPRIEFKIVTA